MAGNEAPDPYESRPWLDLYDGGQPRDVEIEFQSMLEAVRAAAAARPDLAAIKYFDGEIQYGDFDRLTDALAAGLRDRGIAKGDRVALYLQNVPQYVVGMVGIWKAGAIVVAINPMNRSRELTYLLDDSGARALICHESLYADVAVTIVPDSAVKLVLTTSELDFQSRNDSRVFGGSTRVRSEGTEDLAEFMAAYDGQQAPDPGLRPVDPAVLTYTSGTTGEPKGAINTHSNMLFASRGFRDWSGWTRDDIVFAVAPLFHVTGLIAHIGAAFLTPMTLVLGYRFDPVVTAELIEEYQCTTTTGAITAFISMMNADAATAKHLESLKVIYSGGAPIPPKVANDFEKKFGRHIYPCYGLTESTSPVHIAPLERLAPVDPESGALSIGVPIYNTTVRILGEDGHLLPVGEVGEFQIEGPQIVRAYWGKPEETERALPGGRLNTGDVGFMDADGWFYIVDRKKDMISASGYKVWPREVEDVLYGHDAVREAAVVGVPDEYRGESVRAFVSLKQGAGVTPDELVAYCKAQMAAYKYPREVFIMDELPKTTTGKILRRELRDITA